MNRCSISGEETTKSQHNLQSRPDIVVSGVTLAGVGHPDQNHQISGSNTMLSSGKRKHESKEISNANNHDGPAQFSSSLKKNLQTSVKSRSLNDVNQSPLANELDFQHLSKSSDLALEEQRLKQKEKHKALRSPWKLKETSRAITCFSSLQFNIQTFIKPIFQGLLLSDCQLWIVLRHI
ncbi:hypothetical protein PVL29_011993 [Vitis rotundifolia]|uniref:Uncharacterized protein n=1 Tax=Vitis rotundifolia TaxID=103349 RepID=A0AA38ZPV2_VITRO|nr:hypothetical protein PVL29_011993 [Vitis rotundifolia]